MADHVVTFHTGPVEVAINEDAIGPSDGAAAEMQDNPACLVMGCPEPPITHRTMRVSVPIMGESPDGPIVVNRQVQLIQAALCQTHNEMLKADVDTPTLQGKRRGDDIVLAGPGYGAHDRPALRDIDEPSGSID